MPYYAMRIFLRIMHAILWRYAQCMREIHFLNSFFLCVGAIRNLEIAMQEERQAQEKSVAKEPPPDKPTAFQFDLEKSSDEAAVRVAPKFLDCTYCFEYFELSCERFLSVN